jgi:hypothetical protein
MNLIKEEDSYICGHTPSYEIFNEEFSQFMQQHEFDTPLTGDEQNEFNE